MLFKNDERARLDAQTIRTSVGWYCWTHDLVEVTGADALEILEKIFVSNLAKTTVGKTKYTSMLNEDGEIIDDVIVMHMSEEVYWVSTLYGPRLIPWIEAHSEPGDTRPLLLSGGCFLNRRLSSRLITLLEDAGTRPLLGSKVPPGDGGVALGEAWCCALAIREAGLENLGPGDTPEFHRQ